MIRISFLYPNEPGKKFDHSYFAHTHMALVKKRLSALGLIRVEVDRGIAGAALESEAPFISAAHLYFNSAEEFRKAIAACGAELMGDVPNYTDIQPQMQMSEMVL